MRTYFLLACLACARPCSATESLTGLLACRALTESAARLACFDRETVVLASALIASAPTAPTDGRLAPMLNEQQAFGLSGSAVVAPVKATGARPPELAKIEARIVALALTGDGRTLFTLDSTQVWQQIESDGDILAKLGDSVTISRGLLGSYWLKLKSRRGCKVTRVR